MKWTIHAAATEFGVSRETLSRRLKQTGITPKAGAKFSTRQIHTALAGDLQAERTRRERAEADKVERENREAIGELTEWARVERYITERFVNPTITALDSCPPEAEEWKTKTLLPAIRVNLQLPKV